MYLFNIDERFAWACRVSGKFSSARAFILATSRRLVLSARITRRDAWRCGLRFRLKFNSNSKPWLYVSSAAVIGWHLSLSSQALTLPRTASVCMRVYTVV